MFHPTAGSKSSEPAGFGTKPVPENFDQLNLSISLKICTILLRRRKTERHIGICITRKAVVGINRRQMHAVMPL